MHQRVLLETRNNSEIPALQSPSILANILSESKDGDTLPPKDESSSYISAARDLIFFSKSELNDLAKDLSFSQGAAGY
ncbi:hypothetical protein NPIL_592641 [Nephila pilipes]|uniref:Uncharacterized protein n=1 Tax=Nephila pilipes TaxID=299642 RepID=A0A8X6UMK0_NEPPI|nr:hypothetical protein NPIL_592641 [Nephila pilipes]